MQRLVLKYLHTVSQAVNFHLAEIIGHVRASDKYESVLKFSEESIKKAQTNASIFWAKGIELQQVSFLGYFVEIVIYMDTLLLIFDLSSAPKEASGLAICIFEKFDFID